MENRVKTKPTKFSVGDAVLIKLPKIDRKSLDCKNLPCTITAIKPNNKYELACAHGILKIKSNGRDIQPSSGKFPKLSDHPKK
jgi:hypothetical protein